MRIKKLLCSIIFFCCSLILLIVSTSAIAANLKIADLNTSNYDDHGDWQKRVQIIADAINHSGADIIALQEVRYNAKNPHSLDGSDMAEQILASLNTIDPERFKDAELSTKVAMHYNTDEGVEQWEGLSIIYRKKAELQFIKDGDFPLTGYRCYSDLNRRMLQYAEFTYNNRPLYIFNTHFSYNKTCRDENVDEAITRIHEVIHNSNDPMVILLGDLNATDVCTNDGTCAAHDPDMAEKLKAAGLIDLWTKKHHDVYLEPGYTYSASQPIRRIDYAWVNGIVADIVTDIELFANQQVQGIYPSDHYGVVLTI